MGALDFIKPLIRFLPDVEKSPRTIPFKEKMNWTGITLLLFLVMSQIPLFGIQNRNSADPLYWVRAILASNRGTLMELGISPIVTASMVLQLLVGAKILNIDQNVKEDRILYQGAQKFFGIALTVAQAFVYVISGMYGAVGFFGGIFIIAQLTIAGVLVILLDELMQKGYGLGSGTSLFIATNICETILWKAFSPMSINYGGGAEFEGAIIALFHSLLTRNPFYAITHSLFRSHLPNISNLLATALIIGVVVYLQGFRVEIALAVAKVRGLTTSYPIKLFYTSNVPIMLLTSLISNVFFISQILYSKFAGNLLVSLLGTYEDVNGQSVAVGGIAYYLTSPSSLLAVLYDPVHFVIYTTIIISACALFSQTWINISGSSPRDVAKQIHEQGRTISGFSKEYTVKMLNMYIPTAALLGGCCVGALTVVADLLGAIGSGTGILLAVTTVLQYTEMLRKEQELQFAD